MTTLNFAVVLVDFFLQANYYKSKGVYRWPGPKYLWLVGFSVQLFQAVADPTRVQLTIATAWCVLIFVW